MVNVIEVIKYVMTKNNFIIKKYNSNLYNQVNFVFILLLKLISHNFSNLYNSLISFLNKCIITDPASTITQSHWGLPSGAGHKTPIFFNFLVSSSEVAFACLVDLHVAIIKLSAMDDLFFKSIILISSAFASSRMLNIFVVNDK